MKYLSQLLQEKIEHLKDKISENYEKEFFLLSGFLSIEHSILISTPVLLLNV